MKQTKEIEMKKMGELKTTMKNVTIKEENNEKNGNLLCNIRHDQRGKMSLIGTISIFPFVFLLKFIEKNYVYVTLHCVVTARRPKV